MSPRLLKNDFTGWAIVALASMMWGADVLLRPKVLAAGFDSVQVVLLEHLCLGVLFLPILWRARKELSSLSVRELGALLFISWAGSTLATVLLTQAYVVGDPLTATLIQKLQPAFAVVLAGPILKERLAFRFWIWFVVALVGAYLLSFGFSWIGDPFNHKGLLAAGYALSAAVLWGTCTVVGRWTLARLDPLPVAGMRFVLAIPVLIAWTLLGGHLTGLDQAHLTSAFRPLLAIVLFVDALGMSFYYFGLERTSASLATLAELAYPATAILLSLRSAAGFTQFQWVGILLLVASLFFIRRGNLVTASTALGSAT